MLEFTPGPGCERAARRDIAELRNDYEAVIEISDLMIELNDKEPSHDLRRAAAYRRLGEIGKAEADLMQAAAKNAHPVSENARMPKKVAYCYKMIAREYRLLGDTAKALAYYEKAEQVAPNELGIYGTRAEIYISEGLYEKALADANKAVELLPRNPWVRKRRALAHFHLGHYDEALADIAKAVEWNPQDISNLTWISPSQVAVCPNESLC
jgi:tetratricopeptide (TPR) repeat protein